MAQTENAKDFTEAIVFISADGSTWIDVSGHGASVSVDGGERPVGEQHTFSGVKPIVKPGKPGKVALTVRYVYTEEDNDPFDIARTQYDTASGLFYVQYSVDGNWWWKTGAGIIQKNPAPGGEVQAGAIVMSEFIVSCAALTKADAST